MTLHHHVCRHMSRAPGRDLGSDYVVNSPGRMTASEDFAYYKGVAPECLIVHDVGEGVANHHPKFNIKNALVNGVKAEVQIILDYLNQK
jgi:metal-dependent amidase/aminoacylase/carboxypeptidase family protein